MQTFIGLIRSIPGCICLLVFISLFLVPTVLHAANANVTVGPGNQLIFVDASSGNSATTINAGDTIIWTFATSGHTVTSQFPSFDSGFVNAGGTFQHQYNTPGTFAYFCTPHRSLGMTGTVIVQAATQGSFSTTTLDLGSTVVGLKSPGKTLQFTNTSNANLDVSGLAITGDFTQTNDCPNPLPTQQSCNITVFFMPTTAGPRTGTLSLASANATPVQLSGQGISSSGSFSTTTLDFSSAFIGTTGLSKQVQFTNTSSSSLDVSGLAVTGDFSQTNNCSSPLPAQQSCNITVTFMPTTVGTLTGTLTLSSANATPVQLSGQGMSLIPTRITRPPIIRVGIPSSPYFDPDIARREKPLIIVIA